MDKEILEELALIEADKYVSEQTLEIGKRNFAEEIKKYDLSFIEQPIKRKLPLTVRFKIWFRNFKNKSFRVFSDE